MIRKIAKSISTKNITKFKTLIVVSVLLGVLTPILLASFITNKDKSIEIKNNFNSASKIDIDRYPRDELFYVVDLQGISLAVQQGREDGIYDVPDSNVKVTFDNGIIIARWGDAEMSGYYETWFSWATRNMETGIILKR